jgi:hypothetical protein
MKKIENLKKQLEVDLAYLDRSMQVLEYSYDKSKKIGKKKEYVIEELDIYEALTSRYARTADILTQKIIKNLFIIMQEEAKTFIDRCNLAEKLSIVDDAQELFNIRKLRNDIAHEYCISDISEIFNDVLEYSEVLLRISKNVQDYIDKNL